MSPFIQRGDIIIHFFISTYEVEKYDVKLLFSFVTFFAFSFKRLFWEGIVNDMNFKVKFFIITVKSNQKIDRYTLY